MVFDGKVRSNLYNNLSWVKQEELLTKIIDSCDLKENDVCLDIGTGTGIVANELSKKCKLVYGIDNSQDMLSKSISKSNIIYKYCNSDNLSDFNNNYFDKITARMVYHHLDNPVKTSKEIYRTLKPNSSFILCEGFPPYGSREFHKYFLKLKERRSVYTIDDLIKFLTDVGFESISFDIYVMPKVSIKNWLNNSGLSKNIQDILYRIRYNSPIHTQKAENMVIVKDDIYVDWNFVIIKCVKTKES